MRILTLTANVRLLSLFLRPLTAEALHFPLLSQFVRLWYITKVAFDPFNKWERFPVLLTQRYIKGSI